MLHKETVDDRTLELLRALQNEPMLSSFNLVGGTALSLRLGHRKSVDLDLFTEEKFDISELRQMLERKYSFRVSYERGYTLKGFVGEVMLDFILYDYPRLMDPDIIDGIRLESIADIIAMKLSAISQNGTRLKDFIDIAALSTLYSLDDMLGFYTAKFPNSNKIMPAKSITYFKDIDFNEPVIMLMGKYNWKSISKRLIDMTKNPNKIFLSLPLQQKGRRL